MFELLHINIVTPKMEREKVLKSIQNDPLKPVSIRYKSTIISLERDGYYLTLDLWANNSGKVKKYHVSTSP